MPYGVIPFLSTHCHLVKIGVHLTEMERGGVCHMASSPFTLIMKICLQVFNAKSSSGSKFLLFESGLIALRPDGGFVLLPGLVSFFLDLCDDVYRGM